MSQNNETKTDITVQDIASVKAIIELASSRGAFKPSEMVPVGQLYNKIETFLNSLPTQDPSPTPDQVQSGDAE